MKINATHYLVVLSLIMMMIAGYVPASVSTIPSNVRLAVPHNGAYFCTSVGTGNPSYTIPSGGLWISKSTIGVYTDQITSINVHITQTVWDSYFKSWLGGGIRAYMKTCDGNQQSCVDITPQSLTYAGTTNLNLPFTSLNPQTKSMYIVIQSRSTILSAWKSDAILSSKTTVNMAYTKYGLKYVSTTGNPAGALFNGCESSCDLTCPTQKSRSDTGLIYTTENSLLPTESVPVLEYWESLNVDLNAEMGATIWDGTRFCFGGAIYSPGTIKLDNGNTYIYPKTATRQSLGDGCCNGAAISTSTQDKTCVNNKWVVVDKDNRVRCTSDFSCPGQGQNTCQDRKLSGWHCGWDKYCAKGSSTRVECCSQADCPTDQTCQDNECVGGGNFPICGDRIVQAGETCDDGNVVSGDGCSSTCQKETTDCNSECAKMSDLNPLKYVCQSKCFLFDLIENIVDWFKMAAIWAAVGLGVVIITSSVVIGLAIAKKKGKRR